MFWRAKRTKSARRDRRKKLLRVESLEPRQMLTGIVTIWTGPPGPAFPAVPLEGGVLAPVAGDAVLTSDGENNNILMTPTGAGAFDRDGPDFGRDAVLAQRRAGYADPSRSAASQMSMFGWTTMRLAPTPSLCSRPAPRRSWPCPGISTSSTGPPSAGAAPQRPASCSITSSSAAVSISTLTERTLRLP